MGFKRKLMGFMGNKWKYDGYVIYVYMIPSGKLTVCR